MVDVLVAHFIVPEPYLPLTGAQLQTYQNGQLLENLWSKLSKKEQNRLMALAKAKEKENTSNSIGDNDDNIN